MGHFLGIPIAKAVDKLHYLSAGAVGFARGLNDTPKIAALLVASSTLLRNAARYGYRWLCLLLSGVWLSARRVAETMSHRVTTMNSGQGFSANLVTSFLVIAASRLGMPVSTTHVSVGSLFGIGLLSGSANKRVITLDCVFLGRNTAAGSSPGGNTVLDPHGGALAGGTGIQVKFLE